jgi:hypothetical protein
VAFVVRAVYAFRAGPILYPGTDDTWYAEVARSVADGRWGRVEGVTGHRVWTFRFPPAYPWFLALGERLLFWVEALDAARWASVAAGAVGAVVVARLAWRIAATAPPRARVLVALVAGGTVAVSPIVAGASAALMSESLFVAIAAGVLLAADHLLDPDAGRGWTVLLAALLVVGALTRVEGILYLGAPVVVAAVVARRRRAPVGRWIAVIAAGVVAVVAWSGFASVESGRSVALASNGGPLLGANCHDTHYGDGAGYWRSACLDIPLDRLSVATRRELAITPELAFGRLRPPAGPRAEAEVSRVQLDEGLGRIAGDPVGVAHAIPFRLARAFGVYWTATQANGDGFEGRNRTWEAAGRWFHLVVVLPLVIVAAAGLLARASEVGRRARRLVEPRRLVPAAALFGVWVVGIVATYGSARLRAPVEPLFAVLAGVGAAVLAGRRVGIEH